MKKYIICIILISLLTGCKVEYKINLNKYLDLEEKIFLIPTTKFDRDELNIFNLNIPLNKDIDDYSFFETKKNNIEYYKLNIDKEKMTINYYYNNEEYDKYIESTLVNTAYEYISISLVDDATMVLSTSKEFLLFEKYKNLEEVKITINTTYKVLKNNADDVERHNYTWIITKDNAYGKGIYLKVDTTEEDLTFLEKLIRGDYLNIFTISIIIFILSFLIYIYLKQRSKKINKT